MADTPRSGVLLDLDGTLVDSVFAHVAAWDEVLRAHGHTPPLWRIHRAVGMGGDRLVPWLLGRPEAETDAMKHEEEDAFLARADALRPTPGATDLLADLADRGVPTLIASSATGRMSAALLAVLGDPEIEIVTGDDVSTTKPSPDLLSVALGAAGLDAGNATMVGDTAWDAEAARKGGVRCLGVRCGGVSAAELLAAGAVDVVDDPRALVGRL